MVDGEKDEGIFDAEEQAILKRIGRSKIWRLMRDALCMERENLFNSDPKTTEQLWAAWGAIRQVQRLLRESPMLVVLYRRYMAQQEAEKRGAAQPSDVTAEREFSARPIDTDPLDFDL